MYSIQGMAWIMFITHNILSPKYAVWYQGTLFPWKDFCSSLEALSFCLALHDGQVCSGHRSSHILIQGLAFPQRLCCHCRAGYGTKGHVLLQSPWSTQVCAAGSGFWLCSLPGDCQRNSFEVPLKQTNVQGKAEWKDSWWWMFNPTEMDS